MCRKKAKIPDSQSFLVRYRRTYVTYDQTISFVLIKKNFIFFNYISMAFPSSFRINNHIGHQAETRVAELTANLTKNKGNS